MKKPDQVKLTWSDLKKYLKFYVIDSIDEINKATLPSLYGLLDEKEHVIPKIYIG